MIFITLNFFSISITALCIGPNFLFFHYQMMTNLVLHFWGKRLAVWWYEVNHILCSNDNFSTKIITRKYDFGVFLIKIGKKKQQLITVLITSDHMRHYTECREDFLTLLVSLLDNFFSKKKLKWWQTYFFTFEEKDSLSDEWERYSIKQVVILHIVKRH